MKKLLNFFISTVLMMSAIIVIAPSAFAMDCYQDPIYDMNVNMEVVSAVFMRDNACTTGTTILATLSKGEVVHVIATTDGWYKGQRADGTTGWIGMTFLTSTTKSFTPAGSNEPVVNEPLYDVAGHLYEEAIRFIYGQGIVEGYPDGSYKPNNTINRAELVKIVVEAVYNNEFESYANTSCFSDVKAGEWYTKYVCFAKDRGIVEGYSDGTFKPASGVNFVEALKIVMVGYGDEYTVSDPWYKSMVELASANNIIPLDVKGFDQVFSRAQMAELITRNIKFKDGTLNEYLGDKADQRVTYEMLDWQ